MITEDSYHNALMSKSMFHVSNYIQTMLDTDERNLNWHFQQARSSMKINVSVTG